MAQPRLQLEGITKRYPSVVANDGVSLEVAPGEIHAVLGENGAGKSTLMKIIYGAVRADSGAMHWDGSPLRPASPAEARALGISMVFQHFSLFDSLTVAENVLLGLPRNADLGAVRKGIRDKAAEYGLSLEPERPVHTLSVGERQRVEIVRALLTGPRLLILDEPTSVLTPQAVEQLFVTLRHLAATGCSVLYISHKLDEIRSLCHRCTVLRGGRVTGTVDPARETNASLSRLMIGAEPARPTRQPSRPGALALQVRSLSLAQWRPVRRAAPGDRSRPARRGDRRHRRRLRQRPAGAAGGVVGRDPLRAGRRGAAVRCADRRFRPGAAARARAALRTRGTTGARRGAGPVAVAQRAADPSRTGHGRRGRVDPRRAARRDRRGDHRPLPGARGRAAGARRQPVGRQSAEVHRRARDRRRPPGAGRRPAHLGRGRRRGGADPRRTAQRCATRAARCWWCPRRSTSCSRSATGCT